MFVCDVFTWRLPENCSRGRRRYTTLFTRGFSYSKVSAYLALDLEILYKHTAFHTFKRPRKKVGIIAAEIVQCFVTDASRGGNACRQRTCSVTATDVKTRNA